MIGNDWDIVLKNYFKSQDFETIKKEIVAEYDKFSCFPKYENIFNAYKLTPFEKVKVVILGQDPYPTKGYADGLAFSVNNEIKAKSLINIFKEVKLNYPKCTQETTSLKGWARQGVLLLNTSLSVREGEPMSHVKIGWERLILKTLLAVNEKGGVVFMLWGNESKKMLPLNVRKSDNLYLETSHPSPLSAHRGFLGCEHFIKANEFLKDDFIDFSTYLKDKN